MTTFVALLCGVNVGGARRVPMAPLAALVRDLGFTDVATYLQSGNVVLSSPVPTAKVEPTLERALRARFGFPVEVIARTAAAFEAYAAANPFLEAASADPGRVALLVSKAAPKPDAVAELLARARGGERVAAARDALWVHYPQGIGASKLTPALVDRLVGSKVTARNWRTVVKLCEMAGAR